jgi:hypothetical protein
MEKDKELRAEFPMNIEGFKEFNESNELERLEDYEKETLEEVAERLYPENIESIMDGYHDSNSYQRESFIIGAKWQQEQDKKLYSEEEALQILHNIFGVYGKHIGFVFNDDLIKDLFEQYRKK